MFLVRNNKGARPKGTFSAYFITEEVRLPFRREKSYAKVYGEGVSTNASVKTGFQNFVPTISTLNVRHVPTKAGENEIKVPIEGETDERQFEKLLRD